MPESHAVTESPDLQRLRDVCRGAFRAAVDAVDPAKLVRERLGRVGSHAVVHVGGRDLRFPLPLPIVGAGKPVAAMAAGCLASLGEDALRGVVVTVDGYQRSVPGVEVLRAGHPLPDERGLQAARRILGVAGEARQGILVLLGGGASSLLVQPRPPVTLADKVAMTQQLLACGATIEQLNAVRKHLSIIKGGGLLRVGAGPVVTLAISDVVGDDPATIGSGPTVPDPSTFADALDILEGYGLRGRAPATVVELLERGSAGAEPETVATEDALARRATYDIVGTNATALAAAAAAMRRNGFAVDIVSEPLAGDTTVEAEGFARRLLRRGDAASCVIAGGETTVVVRGRGRGGRNQEFALAMVEPIAGSEWVVLSAGTDGVDGPTDAAGALVDGATAGRASAAGLDSRAALAQNDSYGYFATLGDLFRPGPTGTNVMDIKIAVRAAAGQR